MVTHWTANFFGYFGDDTLRDFGTTSIISILIGIGIPIVCHFISLSHSRSFPCICLEDAED